MPRTDGTTEHLIDHKYTIGEIDRMRYALHGILFPIHWISSSGGVSSAFVPGEREQQVELQLRTYLMAGIRPEEVEAKLQEVQRHSEMQRQALARRERGERETDAR